MFQHNKVRINASFKYDARKNLPIYGNEKAVANNLNLDAKYNIQSSGSFGGRLTFANISFNGIANSTIGYTMLDGLQIGKNWIWHANFDKRVSKNIEMSLEYDGRKSGNNQVVHTGRASVRAVF